MVAFSPVGYFVNKVLLEHIYASSFSIDHATFMPQCKGWVAVIIAIWSPQNTVKNIYYMALTETENNQFREMKA